MEIRKINRGKTDRMNGRNKVKKLVNGDILAWSVTE
jgi:hypothetical protein